MASFSTVIMMGNLTKEPTSISNSPTIKVSLMRLATNRQYKNAKAEKQTEVAYVDVRFFGKLAEGVLTYCKKGMSVLVHGRLAYDEWVDKKTEEKKNKLYVIGEKFQIIGPWGNKAAPLSGSTGSAEEPTVVDYDEPPIEEDAIPF